jgi:hypothetical protein
MPVPIIAAGAASVAARLAAKKLAQEAAKKAAKAAAAKTAQIAKNSVKVKPAAKPKANNPDAARIQNKSMSSSNRMIDKGVPSGARAAANAGRKNRIQANKLKAK